MGRLLGYMANRADCLRDSLHQEREVINTPSSDAASPSSDRPAGWGIGFYQGGEVLHKKRPLFQGTPLDWEQVANGVRSDCVVFHHRHATVGDFRAENTHPFRMRSWLFAHSGTVHRFEAVRERLLEAMPDFIRRNIRGHTDSEHFFHVLLSFLHDAGQLERPDIDLNAVLNGLRSTVRLVDRLGKEVDAPPATLNLVLTNGRCMLALRRGSPMKLTERQGFVDIEGREPPKARSGATVPRYVLVVSDGPGVPIGYTEVPEGSVAVIDRTLMVSTHEL